MDDESKEIVPQKRSLFPVSAEDIVDNALHNLDEAQARRVTEKAADEIVRLAVEKRKAEHRNASAHEEMNNLVQNANLLDKQVGDYRINSTFETASGTTNVEIKRSNNNQLMIIAFAGVLIVLAIIAVFFFR